MDNEAVVEQIVRSLSFEVVAIPQDIVQTEYASKSTPLNVKIRVRKKADTGLPDGVISMSKMDRKDYVPGRVRLVSSDQTIMSFDVVMEDRNDNTKDYLTMVQPGSSYKADIAAGSGTQSDGVAKNRFTLSKKDNKLNTSPILTKRNKDIFGRCKPGGCLDPPFGEDKYSYKPAKEISQIKSPTAPTTTDNTNKMKTSSIFKNNLFKRKKNSSQDDNQGKNCMDSAINIQSVISKTASLQGSSTYSTSIITYPPTSNTSDQQIAERRHSKIRYSSEDRSSNASYFILPKKTKNQLEQGSKPKDNIIGDYEPNIAEDGTYMPEHKNNLKSASESKLPEKVNIAPIFIPATLPLLASKDVTGGNTENKILQTSASHNLDVERDLNKVDSKTGLELSKKMILRLGAEAQDSMLLGPKEGLTKDGEKKDLPTQTPEILIEQQDSDRGDLKTELLLSGINTSDSEAQELISLTTKDITIKDNENKTLGVQLTSNLNDQHLSDRTGVNLSGNKDLKLAAEVQEPIISSATKVEIIIDDKNKLLRPPTPPSFDGQYISDRIVSDTGLVLLENHILKPYTEAQVPTSLATNDKVDENKSLDKTDSSGGVQLLEKDVLRLGVDVPEEISFATKDKSISDNKNNTQILNGENNISDRTDSSSVSALNKTNILEVTEETQEPRLLITKQGTIKDFEKPAAAPPISYGEHFSESSTELLSDTITSNLGVEAQEPTSEINLKGNGRKVIQSKDYPKHNSIDEITPQKESPLRIFLDNKQKTSDAENNLTDVNKDSPLKIHSIHGDEKAVNNFDDNEAFKSPTINTKQSIENVVNNVLYNDDSSSNKKTATQNHNGINKSSENSPCLEAVDKSEFIETFPEATKDSLEGNINMNSHNMDKQASHQHFISEEIPRKPSNPYEYYSPESIHQSAGNLHYVAESSMNTLQYDAVSNNKTLIELEDDSRNPYEDQLELLEIYSRGKTKTSEENAIAEDIFPEKIRLDGNNDTNRLEPKKSSENYYIRDKRDVDKMNFIDNLEKSLLSAAEEIITNTDEPYDNNDTLNYQLQEKMPEEIKEINENSNVSFSNVSTIKAFVDNKGFQVEKPINNSPTLKRQGSVLNLNNDLAKREQQESNTSLHDSTKNDGSTFVTYNIDKRSSIENYTTNKDKFMKNKHKNHIDVEEDADDVVAGLDTRKPNTVIKNNLTDYLVNKNITPNIGKGTRVTAQPEDSANVNFSKIDKKCIKLVSPKTATPSSLLQNDVGSWKVDLALHSYTDENNERVVKSFDSDNVPEQYQMNALIIVKCTLESDSNKIKIPIDNNNELTIQIKSNKINQSLTEFCDSMAAESPKKTKIRIELQGDDTEDRDYDDVYKSRTSENRNLTITDSQGILNALTSIYEQELLPLQDVIKDLREEIDMLTAYRTMLKEKSASRRSKPPRVIHVNKRGCCSRRYY